MTDLDSTKRIPKSLGTEAKLFGNYTLADLAVALVPAVVVVLVLQVLVPSSATIASVRVQTLTIPLVAVAGLLGLTFVYLTPTYTTSLDWLATVAGFHRSAATLDHEDAKRYTQLECVHPEDGALERTDGAFVALVQVSPPTMALATDDEWARTAEAFRDFCNTAVQFPVELYSTTQHFPVEQYLGHYEDRLDDPDVQANPRLASLIENYVEWYAADLDERRMTIRDHYVVVSVSPREVQFERESLAQNLAAIPLLGLLVRARYAPRREEARAAMIDALEDRVGQIEAGLREIDGCVARRIEPAAAVEVLAAFWTGQSRDVGETDRKLRRTPLVRGPT